MSGKKPKIAVQLFSYMQTFEKTYLALWDNFLNLYDCDVFIHTWDDFSLLNNTNKYNDIINKINLYYRPKKLLVEKANFINIQGYFGTHLFKKTPLSTIKYILYSQNAVNNYRIAYQTENNTQYDFVLFIRPDLKLNEPFVIENYQAEFNFRKKSSIHFTNIYDAYYIDTMMLYAHENTSLMFLTQPDNANIIADLYNQFDKHVCEYQKNIPQPYKNSDPNMQGEFYGEFGFSSWENSFYEYIYCQGIRPTEYKFNYIITKFNN